MLNWCLKNRIRRNQLSRKLSNELSLCNFNRRFQSPIASTITIIPNTTENVSVEYSCSSVPSIRHLTTAIEDDDDELFSASRRKMPITQVRES